MRGSPGWVCPAFRIVSSGVAVGIADGLPQSLCVVRQEIGHPPAATAAIVIFANGLARYWRGLRGHLRHRCRNTEILAVEANRNVAIEPSFHAYILAFHSDRDTA